MRIEDDEEVLDLIAEAARTSRHAAKAYEILHSREPLTMMTLKTRQRHIEGRMDEAA